MSQVNPIDNNPDYGVSGNLAGVSVGMGVEISDGENLELLDVKFDAQVGPVGVSISPDLDGLGETVPPVSEVKLQLINIDMGLHYGFELDVSIRINIEEN